VQEDVGEPLTLHARAVDLDDVGLPHHGVQLTRRTVDTYSSCADQLVRPAAGSDAGSREVGVEAHPGILARVPA